MVIWIYYTFFFLCGMGVWQLWLVLCAFVKDFAWWKHRATLDDEHVPRSTPEHFPNKSPSVSYVGLTAEELRWAELNSPHVVKKRLRKHKPCLESAHVVIKIDGECRLCNIRRNMGVYSESDRQLESLMHRGRNDVS